MMLGTRTPAILVLVAVLCLAACGNDATRPPIEIDGGWGGAHIALAADSDGATVEYDCGHGTIDGALILDSQGEFDLLGGHVREGGPIRVDDPPVPEPARYQGHLEGSRLVITVTLTDSGDVLGPFELRKGVSADLHKCL
jgi:hypothetical protein